MNAALRSSISVPVMLDIGSALYGMTRKQISYGILFLVAIVLCLSEELGSHRTAVHADCSRMTVVLQQEESVYCLLFFLPDLPAFGGS